MLGEQAKQLVKIIEEVTLEIKRVDQWLRKQAEADHRVMLLQTHPGVGLLTSLVLVHTLLASGTIPQWQESDGLSWNGSSGRFISRSNKDWIDQQTREQVGTLPGDRSSQHCGQER